MDILKGFFMNVLPNNGTKNAVPGNNSKQESNIPADAQICSRKVARSGHISYEGRPYFISKTLAGRYIRLIIIDNRMIIDTVIPLHKEYPLL